jgi:hypothetical protein
MQDIFIWNLLEFYWEFPDFLGFIWIFWGSFNLFGIFKYFLEYFQNFLVFMGLKSCLHKPSNYQKRKFDGII